MEISVKFTNIEKAEAKRRMSDGYLLPEHDPEIPIEFWSVSRFISYVNAEYGADDEKIMEFVENYIQRKTEEKRRKRQKKEEEKVIIISTIEDIVIEYLGRGETTTELVLQEFVKNEVESMTKNYNAVDGSKITRPKVRQALKELEENGILKMSVRKPDGYSNYVKCYTRI